MPTAPCAARGATLIRDGERVTVARRARSHPLRRAPSARRRSCSFRGIGPARAAARTRHRRACTSCPASAPTCRITCRSARCSRCAACARSTRWRRASGAGSASGSNTRCAAPGPMSMAPSQLGAFVRSDPSRPHANLQYHVQPLSPARLRSAARHLPGVHRQRLQSQSDQPRHACASAARSIDDPPRIAPNYLSTDEDRRVAAESLRVTRRIVAQPALAQYSPTSTCRARSS